MSLLIFISLLLFSTGSFAHSVEHSFPSGGTAVEFRYSDGTPLAHAEVTLFREGTSQPFQKCYSDGNGRFAFVPEKGEKYYVVRDDGMGHGKRVDISGAGTDVGKEARGGGIPLYFRIITGVSIIWAVAATFYACARRRKCN